MFLVVSTTPGNINPNLGFGDTNLEYTYWVIDALWSLWRPDDSAKRTSGYNIITYCLGIPLIVQCASLDVDPRGKLTSCWANAACSRVRLQTSVVFKYRQYRYVVSQNGDARSYISVRCTLSRPRRPLLLIILSRAWLLCAEGLLSEKIDFVMCCTCEYVLPDTYVHGVFMFIYRI